MRAELPAAIDIDLQGWIGLRLIDAAPGDLAAVERGIGSVRTGPLPRPPDLRVRFVDRLATADLRHVDGERTSFTDDGFFVAGRRGRGLARIPFDGSAGAAEIVCERGAGTVPFLLEMLRLTALSRGIVGVHASAFEYRGTGVLAIGWPHGGKTSALLAFAAHGARLVGDDLVFLADGGRRMFGLAAPIEVSDWQLAQVPRLWREVGAGRRLVGRSLRALDRIQARAADGLAPARLLRSVLPPLERRLRVRLPARAVCPGPGPHVSSPDRVLLMLTHEAGDIRVEAPDPDEALQRVLYLARADGLSLLRSYLGFRFAFPSRSNDLVENAHTLEAKLLRDALAGREIYLVRHPRPVSLRALHAALSPVLGEAGRSKPAITTPALVPVQPEEATR